MPKFEDKKLECDGCGAEFVWDASEQAYFEKKGFKEAPKRCRACRQKRKLDMEKEKANEKEIVCLKCNKKAATTEELSPDEEVICMDCIIKEQAQE